MTPLYDGLENGDVDPGTLMELRRLARSQPHSGRQSAAKASALRTLERLGRGRGRRVVPPMPEDWYPLGSEWEALDRAWLAEHPEARECWWTSLHREGLR